MIKGTKVTGIWRDINTAPKDGTVIITDEGTACFVNQRNWGSPVPTGWFLCAFGCQPELSYDGQQPVNPSVWLELQPR